MTTIKRRTLPHQTDQKFVTEVGFETSMLFHKGFDMPQFAFFPMLRSQDGRAAMKEYIVPLMKTARQHDAGFILDTNTWRSSPDWLDLLGYAKDEHVQINREAVEFAHALRQEFGKGADVIVNGVIGPRGDGYDPSVIMTADEAEDYHAFQVGVFADNKVDMVSALTITNTPEAIGIARAAGDRDVPCVISFTLETDGHLPTGEALADAIDEVDTSCSRRPAYYMINCAHPDHFSEMLELGGDWVDRIRGVRCNASRLSHAELDGCSELDDGDPSELAQQYTEITRLLPNLNVFGGCCGTDHRHLTQICNALHAGGLMEKHDEWSA